MIILVGGEKGGTGKSTLVTNLAAYRQSQTGSNDILIIDTDIQGSASDWCYYRSENGLPNIESIQLFEKKIINEVPNKAKRYEDILIDAGGRDSQELRASMVVADKMIVPIRASQYDIASVEKIEQLLDELRLSANPDLECFVIVNSLKANPRIPEFHEAMEALEEFEGITPVKFPIYDRMAFARSGAEGKGVHEMDDKDKKATSEIKKLHDLIYE